MDELRRAVEAVRRAPRPFVRGAAPEKVQRLRQAHSAGRGVTEKLTADNDKPYFVYGLSPFTDDYVI